MLFRSPKKNHSKLKKNRVARILQSQKGSVEVEQMVEQYNQSYKPALQKWKSHFVTLEAFLKIGCGAEIRGTRVVLANNSTSIVASPQSSVVRYLTRPQFSFFFGFGDEKCKAVAYRVWRFEVESAIQENLHSHEVIAEQIRKSLQGEAKTKIFGFDQFYGDEGAALGDELVSQAYSFRQQEGGEVSVFASRLDNQIRQAKNHGVELLPGEEAVDRHLRLLLWQGLKESIKDKLGP